MQCNTIQYNTIQYNTIQYNTIQCNAMQYNIRLIPKYPTDTAATELQKQEKYKQ